MVEDKRRSGRPIKMTPETIQTIKAKLETIHLGRGKSVATIAKELKDDGITISAETVRRFLKAKTSEK